MKIPLLKLISYLCNNERFSLPVPHLKNIETGCLSNCKPRSYARESLGLIGTPYSSVSIKHYSDETVIMLTTP